MLPSQRPLFEIPPGIAYLDAAAWSPLPRSVSAAGVAGIAAKARPWEFPRIRNEDGVAAARAAAARLIGAAAQDIAIQGSVAQAMATAARNLELAPGQRILRMADEFPSLCLVFERLAAERGLVVEVVPRPEDGDWTAALLAAIGRPGAAPLALALLTPLHWSDGALVDLDALAPAVRAAGAALVIDATQAAGVLPVDVGRWQPDFLAFPTYKWVLGPYGLAFLYVAPHRQAGLPVEEHNGNRPSGGYAPGALRYDRGERADPVAPRMAAAGLELVLEWGPPAIAARLAHLTGLLAAGLAGLGTLPPRRAPHVLGLRCPGGLPAGLVERLAGQGVYLSDRLGVLRISPHVWNEEADLELALDRIKSSLAG
ncbi:aminotransferase class V-fold PLP-dependent enzyme [Roseomonas sp. 18066]|uniref:aminotransferase class V-fold PLP-dependent enzyme n=1 Tax=Roseomonas sp. 18066 TaxID=2681412 RepID=UPI001357F768|nr:aminotransferase class V-fold PLP-dependent enzyme [Roseomonas sp. 18066]